MKKLTTKQVTTLAMFIALTTVATMLIQIPIPATKGYLNIGDTILICAGLLMGKIAGGIVGGLGSALADLITGYTFYAPITLVVKGLEGFVAGLLHEKTKLPHFLCAIVGGLVMALGYFLAEGLILYNFGTAILSLGPNVLQGLAGSILASLLYPALKKSSIKGNIDRESFYKQQKPGVFNWGAFALGPIWAFGNKLYLLAILSFIPLVNIILAFVAGFKGNEWAARNLDYRDMDEFAHIQEPWNRAGIISFIIAFSLAFLYVVAVLPQLVASI